MSESSPNPPEPVDPTPERGRLRKHLVDLVTITVGVLIALYEEMLGTVGLAAEGTATP